MFQKGTGEIVSPENNGGAERDRTVDLLNAIQALSQTELQPHFFEEREASKASEESRTVAPERRTGQRREPTEEL